MKTLVERRTWFDDEPLRIELSQEEILADLLVGTEETSGPGTDDAFVSAEDPRR